MGGLCFFIFLTKQTGFILFLFSKCDSLLFFFSINASVFFCKTKQLWFSYTYIVFGIHDDGIC